MFRYVIRRLLISIPVLLVSSILVFWVVWVTQHPLQLLYQNTKMTPSQVHRIQHDLGLDKKGYQIYTSWLLNFLRGHWGSSLFTNRPVAHDIQTALANSAVLGLTGTAIALLIGVVIGAYSAIRQYSVFDNIATTGSFVALSIPNFWFAVLLQILFGLYLTRWMHLGGPLLPVAGINSPGSVGFHLLDRMRHLILPAIVLAVQILAAYSRYTRASMLDVLHSDYLRTARAKGLNERRVIVRHAMRNALIPVTTQLAIDIGAIAGGLIITEGVFQYPGMGLYFIKAMNNSDFPQILPWLMVTVASVIIFNLLADIMYAVLDPRVRYA